MSDRLLIFGASGHGRVVADVALSAGWELVGWADDDPAARGRIVAGAPVVACGLDEAAREAENRGAGVLVAVGNPWARRDLFDGLCQRGARPVTVVHPSATIAPSAQIGPGTVVVAGAVVNPDAVIGSNSIVNTLAGIDHDCLLGDHTHISPGASLGGTVQVGEGTHIGIGATLRNNLRVGAWSVIGAGAVVVSDIPDGVVAFGVPARIVRKNQP